MSRQLSILHTGIMTSLPGRFTHCAGSVCVYLESVTAEI